MTTGHDALALAREVIERCRQHGFALAGIAEARPSDHADAFRRWIGRGEHGPMGYLAEDVERRLDPGALVPGARSVICVADRYADGRPDRRIPGHGRIARYARGEDYHVVVRARLEALADELQRRFPGARFRTCVDTAPLMEREHAERAGLGSIGKHTLLIGPGGIGSWLVLGAVVSTLELAPVRADGTLAPHEVAPRHDPCGGCTRCIDACPTGAIAPWSVDARRCISTATIEERGGIGGGFFGRSLDWIFGCDACQEACPHSQPTRRSRASGVHEAYTGPVASLPLLEVLDWDDARWHAARLNGVLRRADSGMWRRNAALAAAGALVDPALDEGDRARLRAALAAIAADPSEEERVREAAVRALGTADAR